MGKGAARQREAVSEEYSVQGLAAFKETPQWMEAEEK